jgi:hypothetical protein
VSYKQYIFALTPRDDGDYEIRINAQSYQPRLYDRATHLPTKNRDFYQADQSQVVYVDQKVLTHNACSDFERSLAQDGLITPGVRSLTLLDYLTYSGTDGTGSAVSVTAPDRGSLFEEIFQDRTAVHTIFFSRRKTLPAPIAYDSGTAYGPGDMVFHHGDWWELGNDAPATVTGSEPGGATGYTEDTSTWVRARHTYIIADIKGDTITADPFSVANWPDTISTTQHQRILQTIKFECDDAAIRLQSHVVQDMFEFMEPLLDYAFTNVPAYGGITNKVGETFLNGSKQNITANEIFSNQYVHASIAPAAIDINDKLHWINLATFLARLAATADFEHSYTTDLTTGMQYWVDKLSTFAVSGAAHPWTVWSDGTGFVGTTNLAFNIDSININSSTTYTGFNVIQKLHVAYEWLVGSNPLCDPHVSKMTSDATLDWDAPLSEAVAYFCNQFIEYEVTEINQATKKPILRLLNRRDTTGDPIPNALRLGPNVKKSQTNISAQHVETKNKGDADLLASPNRRGKAITKEVPRRAKLRGRNGKFNGNDSTYNAGLSPDQQSSCWNTFVGGIRTGGHILATDATIANYGVDSDGHILYTVISPSINANVLTPGDRCATLNAGYGVVTGVVSRNEFTMRSDGLYSVALGTNKTIACGYEHTADNGDIAVTDGTEFHVPAMLYDPPGFEPHIGKTLYIPARGIFTILSARTVGTDYYCTVDAPLGLSGTGLLYRISPADFDAVTINPNGFVGGSMLYVYDPSTTADYLLSGTNDLFNGTEDVDILHGSFTSGYSTDSIAKGYTDDDWSGMYAVSRSCYGLPDSGFPDTAPGYEYGNTIAGAVQVWAAELVGAFATRVLEYDFQPSQYGDQLTAIKLLGTIPIDENGTVTNYYATGVRFNEIARPQHITYTLTEQPTDPTGPIDSKLFPIIKLGNGSSGGASSVGGAGGGSAGTPSTGSTLDLGDAVITKPNTVTRNLIFSQGDAIPELGGVRHSATSTADHIAFYNEDLTTKTFYVDKNGAWHVALSTDTVAGKITMAPGQSSHALIVEDSSHVVLTGIDAAGAVFAQDVQDFSLTVDGPVKSVGGYLVNGNIDVSSEITGTVSINHGGTNAITASGALNNLTPTQTGHAGEYLSTDGAGNITWQPSSGGSTSSAGNKVYNFKSFQ